MLKHWLTTNKFYLTQTRSSLILGFWPSLVKIIHFYRLALHGHFKAADRCAVLTGADITVTERPFTCVITVITPNCPGVNPTWRCSVRACVAICHWCDCVLSGRPAERMAFIFPMCPVCPGMSKILTGSIKRWLVTHCLLNVPVLEPLC